MKVLFFIVNYKADDCLLKLIQSISCSKSACAAVEVYLCVLDNSMKDRAASDAFRVVLNQQGLEVMLLNSETNSGYFGGLPRAQRLVDDSFDYVIYCNPDLYIEPDFFELLEKQGKKAGIIAPSIIDEHSGYNENPEYLERLTKKKLLRLKSIYGNLMLFTAFIFMARMKEWLVALRHTSRKSKESVSQTIYAPHGAMFVFSDIHFFKHLPAYPCFLFAEELFVAEEALKANVVIYYEPALKVKDIRHVSVNLLNSKYKRSLYYKSIVFILDNYYMI